uniref:Uncharacterized protein n=1 Tax=Amphimedon queenslandica TaxID=400682 RepID=A0A1X7U0T1_AMPQE
MATFVTWWTVLFYNSVVKQLIEVQQAPVDRASAELIGEGKAMPKRGQWFIVYCKDDSKKEKADFTYTCHCKRINNLEDFITELKQFLMEQRVIKKTNLKKEKRLLCPQSQAIEKFLSSQDVTKVVDKISKKRKIDTDDERYCPRQDG